MPNSKPALYPASTQNIPTLIQLLNAAYADYYVPIYMDENHFLRMCAEEDVDLHKSVVALVQHMPVGLALLSQRGSHGWISGVGVRPGYRRQGIGHAMIQYLQNTTLTQGLTHLWLETLTQNKAGQSLYQNLGFEWERDLLVLTANPGQIPQTTWTPHIRAAAAATLLHYHPHFHQIRTPWQRSQQTLKNRGDSVQGLAYWHNNDIHGYILYERESADYAILDLAVTPNCTHPIHVGSSLLSALHTRHSDLNSYIINVPAVAPLTAAFTQTNYRIAHQQYEMLWKPKM